MNREYAALVFVVPTVGAVRELRVARLTIPGETAVA